MVVPALTPRLWPSSRPWPTRRPRPTQCLWLAAGLALAPAPALAEFHGGGVLFGFTVECGDWGADGPRAVRLRHAPAEDIGRPPSELLLAFGTGTEHLTLWGEFEPGPGFRGVGGRQTWSQFAFYDSQPRLRVVERRVPMRIDPQGPATVANARELLLRLRIQNFANLPGCAATLVATLRRID